MLTRMSSRSKCLPSSAKISSTESGMPTLPWIATARRPSARIFRAKRFGLLGAVVVVGRDIAAAARKLERDGAADAARGAGDESDLSGQCTGHVGIRCWPALNEARDGRGSGGQNRYFNPARRVRYNRAFRCGRSCRVAPSGLLPRCSTAVFRNAPPVRPTPRRFRLLRRRGGAAKSSSNGRRSLLGCSIPVSVAVDNVLLVHPPVLLARGRRVSRQARVHPRQSRGLDGARAMGSLRRRLAVLDRHPAGRARSDGEGDAPPPDSGAHPSAARTGVARARPRGVRRRRCS